MKRFLPVASALLFGACVSDDAPPVAQGASAGDSPRYATSEEILRLQKEARANFERERQLHQGGALPPVGEGPSTLVSVETARVAAPSPTPRTTRSSSSRRSWSVAEIHYAMQIGKSASDLTAGERAAARSE
jgi:hypothetical protein